MKAGDQGKRRLKLHLTGIGSLIIICGLLFIKTATYDYVEYDDPAYITGNAYVTDGVTADGLKWAFTANSAPGKLLHDGVENLWHPLTWISHMVDVELYGGDNPQRHHVTSLLLYLLTIPFIYLSVQTIFKNSWVSFFLTLLWLVHPMKVESVAWISERKDILSGLFFWASLYCALRSFSDKRYWKHVGLALFILALLSKPSVVVLPALIILVSGYLQQSPWNLTFLKSELKKWWLWIAAAGAVSVLTVIMQSGGSHDYFIQNSSIIQRISTASAAFWFYIYRILVPWNLNFFYEQPVIGRLIQIITTFSLMGLVYLAWEKRNTWRTFFLGFSWFIICWLPVSGLVYVGASFTADRYMYLALAGLLFPLVIMLNKPTWGKVVLTCLALGWMSLSWFQLDVWKNGWTLFTHSTQTRPKATIGWTNLGTLQRNSGQHEAALESYTKASQVNPLDYSAWYHLGLISAEQGNSASAVDYYKKALETYPEHIPSILNLGGLKQKEGKLQEALAIYRRGKAKDVRLLWLTCECEMLLKDYKAAQKTLGQLEQTPNNHPAIKEGMIQVKKVLNQYKGAE